MSKNLIILATLVVVSYVLFKDRKGQINEDDYQVVRQFHPQVEQPVVLKSSAIRKELGAPVKMNLVEADELHRQDQVMEKLKDQSFPNGKLVESGKLPNDSRFEIYESKHGDRVTNVYHQNILNSTKWEMPSGKQISRDYQDNQLLALTETIGNDSVTLIFDHNSLISKRVEVHGNKMTCYRYDSTGHPAERHDGQCTDDSSVR